MAVVHGTAKSVLTPTVVGETPPGMGVLHVGGGTTKDNRAGAVGLLHMTQGHKVPTKDAPNVSIR